MSINTVNNHPDMVEKPAQAYPALVATARKELEGKLEAELIDMVYRDMQNMEQFSAKYRPQVEHDDDEPRTLETLKAKCCQFKASCLRFVNKGRTRQDNSKDANTSKPTQTPQEQ